MTFIYKIILQIGFRNLEIEIIILSLKYVL